jgi:ribulose-5-phosphate 4-epimerase/fuculose-1-phosphate aldolase
MQSDALKADLVRANHILARHNVLDAFGHVSARDSANRARYHLSISKAPALVAPDDITLYGLDSHAAGEPARPSYVERFIHGEIYKAREDVGAVVHCHSPELVSFAAIDVPLRPIYHMAAGIGCDCARFEIRDHEPDGGNMLVRSAALGAALAKSLGERQVSLMRGHGATIVAPTIRQAVFRAIFLQLNARIQIAASSLGSPRYLSPEEVEASSDLEGAVERAWNIWVHELAQSASALGGPF